jgi:ATP-binding cassette subfamily F protein uup
MAGPLLLGCQDVAKAYGARTLFQGLSFGVFEGDHACLVGPNGSGKSTLLKILAGIEPPDRGTRSVHGRLRVGYVPQDPVFPAGLTVEDAVLAGLDDVDPDERPARLAVALGRAGFTESRAEVDALSGGWKKRLAIARELAAAPDVLLMDEPTNHLDVGGILWLEGLLVDQARAFLVVSHDRYFLERVATRVLELNPVYPNGLFATDGSYSDFLARRDEALRGQAAYEDSLANLVRREIAWLRRGAKARSTKARGRIKEAERLIAELDESRMRSAVRAADIELAASQRRTRRLLVARGVSKTLGGRALFRDVDLTITPGTRVGLLGPNGSGKTSLLDVLAGDLAPDSGTVERADALQLVRFEQERSALDPTQTLRRALAPEGDTVTVQGRSIHVASWAKRFLFHPEQLELLVGRLSGGEQARILIARLMLQPADVLLLDEPTNDLDIPTLEVLEESLAEFPGGLVLVTHDRFMLDRLSTVVLALDGRGGAETFADYAQWETAREAAAREVTTSGPRPTPARERSRTKRLGYLEQREWVGMEQAILDAEAAMAARQQAADDPAIASDPVALQERHAALEAARVEVDRLYARWAELEAKQAE